MKIDGLLWSEIQEIRIAVKKHKEDQWDILKKNFKKGLTFDVIQEARKGFDADTNKFRIEGRCNEILGIIQTLDTNIQWELVQK